MSPSSPVVLVDSGLCGLSVARAIRDALPREEIVFLASWTGGGIGAMSEQRIARLASDALRWAATLQPKQVVLTCHSMAAVHCGDRARFGETSICGIVEPAARAAVELAGAKQMPLIGILATEATILSKAYERTVHRRRHHARMLLRPISVIETLLTEGRSERDPLLKLALKQYVHPLLERGVDVIVPACNSLSIVKELLHRVVGEKIKIVDAAERCAQDVARRLQAAGLLRGGDSPGGLRCFVSDQPARCEALAKRFYGHEVGTPLLTRLDELHPDAMNTPIRAA